MKYWSKKNQQKHNPKTLKHKKKDAGGSKAPSCTDRSVGLPKGPNPYPPCPPWGLRQKRCVERFTGVLAMGRWMVERWRQQFESQQWLFYRKIIGGGIDLEGMIHPNFRAEFPANHGKQIHLGTRVWSLTWGSMIGLLLILVPCATVNGAVFREWSDINLHPPLCDSLGHHISIHFRDRKTYSSHFFSYRAQNQPSAHLNYQFVSTSIFFDLSLSLLHSYHVFLQTLQTTFRWGLRNANETLDQIQKSLEEWINLGKNKLEKWGVVQ